MRQVVYAKTSRQKCTDVLISFFICWNEDHDVLERERERERVRDRQTARQTDRQTDRQRPRDRDRETGTERDYIIIVNVFSYIANKQYKYMEVLA